MKKIKGIQEEWIDQLCRNTWNDIYRFIYYKVQNREEAQDITQETYAKMISYLGKKVEILDYDKYLKTVAMNLIRDKWRNKKRQGISISYDEAAPEEMAAEDFSNGISDKAYIEAAMGRLTEEQSTVIDLRIIKGYSCAETAKLMNKKEGTVRVLQYRALKALSVYIDENIRKDEKYKGLKSIINSASLCLRCIHKLGRLKKQRRKEEK
jgi:RNA polymerase sigma-70 factor (ECF subfamily)